MRKVLLAVVFLGLGLIAVNNSFAAKLGGKVVNTMNAGGYTYVELEKDGKKIWAAAPETKIAVGTEVELPDSVVPMQNFQSKSLNRTFESIYFVGALPVKGGAAPAKAEAQASSTAAASDDKMPPGHPKTSVQKAADNVNFGPSKKAAGGYTVEELFVKSKELKGKKVKVRGKVIKSSQGIMGKNWVHIQDGTGKGDQNDLTLTTQQVINNGDTVLAEGTLETDKNFGGGYLYKVIIEESTFTVE